MRESILVTGATGFIGSHTCTVLLDAGYDVIALDNLRNSEASVIGRIAQICGREPLFIEGDIRDKALLNRIFTEHAVSAVIHFAGLKAVGESLEKPLEYYENYVGGTLVLLRAMRRAKVRCLVFSSSATVYGDPASVPIAEDSPRFATNPYGATKLIIEDILADLQRAEEGWRIARLRYFNPVGAHPSGLIGEQPVGTPNNLMPFVSQAAAGLRDELSIFGNDYDTPDGTGIRDYIHVMDLAEGHVSALRHLGENPGMLTVNLGTGRGVTVLELIDTFENVNGCKVPYRFSGRRKGDVARCWADIALAHELLHWKASRGLEDMCRDAWNWQLQTLGPAPGNRTPHAE